MKISIAGATGLTGNICLNLLLKSEVVTQVIAIGRSKTGILHDKLDEVLLVNGKLPRPIASDAFICCLGKTIRKAGSKQAFVAIDHGLPVYLAKELQKEGCKIMAVISAVSADPVSWNLYSRTKGQMEEELQILNFETLSVVRPSFIIGNRNERRLLEDIGMALIKMVGALLIGRLSKYTAVDATSIAHTLIDAVITPVKGTSVLFPQRRV